MAVWNVQSMAIARAHIAKVVCTLSLGLYVSIQLNVCLDQPNLLRAIHSHACIHFSWDKIPTRKKIYTWTTLAYTSIARIASKFARSIRNGTNKHSQREACSLQAQQTPSSLLNGYTCVFFCYCLHFLPLDDDDGKHNFYGGACCLSPSVQLLSPIQLIIKQQSIQREISQSSD